MTDDQYKLLKATMPWTQQVFQSPRGGIVQVVNNKGEEVPMFDMTNFLVFITNKLTQPITAKETAQKESAAPV